MLLEKKDVDVVEAFDEEEFNQEGRGDPQAVVVAEQGKIWAQARLVGGLVVAGESACVELQVKNHSTKKVGFIAPLVLLFGTELTYPSRTPLSKSHSHDSLSYQTFLQANRLLMLSRSRIPS